MQIIHFLRIKENLVLKYGSSQSEVKSMRRLLAVIRSKFRKFKISHRHLVQKLERDNNAKYTMFICAYNGCALNKCRLYLSTH